MRFYHVAVLLLLMGCGNQKQLIEQTVVVDERPVWVKNRPISNSSYLGISMVSKLKNPSDYARVAKENALHDLASEIQVNINSNSFFYQLDRDYKFEEEFKSAIQTSTEALLEGYELVDTYETETQYWSYYRLSKLKYQTQREERKNASNTLALDFYEKGNIARGNGDVQGATDLYLRGLVALKEFWGELHPAQHNRKTVFIENEIYSSLMQLYSNLDLHPGVDVVNLNYNNKFKQRYLATVKYKEKLIPKFPVYVVYPAKQNGDKTLYSDQYGVIRFNVEQLQNVKNPEIMIQPNVDALLENLPDKTIIMPIVKKLESSRKLTPINIEYPKLYLEKHELNFGDTITLNGLAYSLKGEFTKRKFSFVQNKAEADLILQVKSDVEKGGASNGFFVALLNSSIKVIKKNGEVLHQENITRVKGIQLDYKKAGNKAYENAKKQLKRSTFGNVLSAIL